MATKGIQGNLLEVTIASCNNLTKTEWLTKQDPYVCVEYGSERATTRTCKDGDKNPIFQEKFVYTLIEGLRELNVNVWNRNRVSHDDLIGTGKVQLAKALSQGFDDSSWPLKNKAGRYAGEIRLIMQYSNANKPQSSDAVPYFALASPYLGPLPHPPTSFNPPTPNPIAGYPSVAPKPPAGYPVPSPYPSYTPNLGAYPPSPYPPQEAFSDQTYPPNSVYPPQPYGSQYSPRPPFPGTYPPTY